MSQRNPNNERNTQEGAKKGVTRKSASSAKPKREAAGSVVIAQKTPAQKKAEAKTESSKMRERQRELDRKYYNPPTPQFKRMKKIWWVAIACAIIFAAASFLLQNRVSGLVQAGVMVLAYVSIFAAIYIDMVKIRNLRREYQMQMINSKEYREEEKAEKKAAAKAAAEAKRSGEPAKEEAPKKKGLFGFGK